MRYLLDTNACIVYLNQADSGIRSKIQKMHPKEIFLCSVVKSELIFGAMKSQRVEKNLQKLEVFFSNLQSIPFDDRAAEVFGDIRADLQKKGTPIGPYDLQIASIALVNDLILITHNTGEFERINNLKLEDWEQEC